MTDTNTSYLSDAQKDGKASGKMPIEDLEKAINSTHIILDQEVVDYYKNTPEEEWKTSKLCVYCHDCREIVPPGIGKGRRGKTRMVCGKCQSKKISSGSREALERFYHVRPGGAAPEGETPSSEPGSLSKPSSKPTQKPAPKRRPRRR